MLGTKYDQCMMIGNDVNMDMAARNSDILTFYLQTDPGEPQINIENADFSGDFNKLCFILGLTELTFPPENNNLFPIRLQFILIRNDIGHYNFICKFPLFSDSILKFEAKIYGFK